MLATHFGEGLVGALHDALGADVDPDAGGHLAVHHEPLAIELVEMSQFAHLRHQIGVGDQHARCVRMGPEHTNRLARLHQQGLVLLEPLQSLDNLVEAVPVARGPANSAVDDQALRILGDLSSRLFISIRTAASVVQCLALISLPRRARMCRELSLRRSNCFPVMLNLFQHPFPRPAPPLHQNGP